MKIIFIFFFLLVYIKANDAFYVEKIHAPVSNYYPNTVNLNHIKEHNKVKLVNLSQEDKRVLINIYRDTITSYLRREDFSKFIKHMGKELEIKIKKKMIKDCSSGVIKDNMKEFLFDNQLEGDFLNKEVFFKSTEILQNKVLNYCFEFEQENMNASIYNIQVLNFDENVVVLQGENREFILPSLMLEKIQEEWFIQEINIK